MLSIQRAVALFATLCLTPLLAGMFVACAASGSNDVGSTTDTAGSMTYRDYTNDSAYTLLSDAQLIKMGIPGETMDERRLNFDSTEQVDAATKICHDDAIAGLAQAFEASKIAKDAIEGPAPMTAGERDSSFELMVDGRTRHVMKNTSSDRVAFIEFVKLYLEVYNSYQGHANLGDNATEFKQAEPSVRQRGYN